MVPQEPKLHVVLLLPGLQDQPSGFITSAVSYCHPGDSPLLIYVCAL